MALFIDSSDPKEIRELYAWGVLSGVTTNPLIISKEAPDADLGERIREVLAVSWGDVSVELTTETEAEMLDEAAKYHAWDPKRITIKVPFSGATYVSIFSGRVRDMGYDVKPVIRATRDVLDREGLASKIIVGSMRHMMDVNEALEAGAHVPTITPPILRKMVWNPRTIETIEEFNSAWRN